MPHLALLVDDVVTQTFALEKSRIVIGRSPQCDICIDDTSVSSNHAVVLVSPNELLDGHDDIFIQDLESRNGTKVNGKIVQKCLLHPNDVVAIGWNKFKLLDDQAGGRETTVLMVMD